MTDRKRGRRRGAILTALGYQKLQAARTAAEESAKFGDRYTKEELAIITGLSVKTLSKIFDRWSDLVLVDKQTLALCFTAFNLVLEPEDYTSPDAIDPVDMERFDALVPVALLPQQPPRPPSDIDWGEAPDIAVFYGRVSELATLTTWVDLDRCRLIMILGMGGVGKTALVTKLAVEIQSNFTKIVWRSLRNAPPVDALVSELIQILSPQADILAPTIEISVRLSQLVDCLRQQRCLLVLDNAEVIIPSRRASETQRREYAAYTQLFERVGESSHQSCLLVTSREKPEQIVSLEGEKLPVRTLTISGLNPSESEALFAAKGLSASAVDRTRLCDLYSGNPLALNIVATSIYNLFDGDIQRFLAAEVSIFNGIRQLLDRQFDRLSPAEQTVMYSLAIERNWLSLDDLHDRIIPTTTKPRLLSTLDSLQRRSLIEDRRGKFTQQAVVMEYMTERTIDRVVRELANWDVKAPRAIDLPLWLSYPFLASQSPEYVRQSQKRAILEPIASQLQLQFGPKLLLTNHLQSILASLQSHYGGVLHYGGGNLINLCRYLQIDLNDYNFAELPIWQADLQGATLHNVNFSGADLSRSLFTHDFGGIFACAFNPDARLMATGEYGGDIYVWQVANKQLQFKFQGHTNWIWAIEFSPDGRLLASASQDATVRLWDVATRRTIHLLQADTSLVLSLAFSPTSISLPGGISADILATAHNDGSIRLWNVASGELIRTLMGHTKQAMSIRFSPDGTLLATGSDDGTVKIWDAVSGNCLQVLTAHTGRIWAARFSPDGQWLATCSGDGTIRIWACPAVIEQSRDERSRRAVATWNVVEILTGYRNWFFAIEFSPDGRFLAIGNVGNVVKIWDLGTKQQILTLSGHSARVATLQFSTDGRLLVTGSGDRSVRLWDTRTWQELYCWQGYSNWIESVVFHPNGTRLLTGSQNGIVAEWDVQTGTILQTFVGHQLGLWSVSYSPDGRSIVSGSADSTVKVWDAEAGQLLQTLSARQGDVWSVRFSPDGRLIAGISMDNMGVCVWLSTGALLTTLFGHTNLVRSIAFSPNSKLLATASFDCSWQLWDVEKSQMLGSYPGHDNWIWDLAWSRDGEFIATCSADCTARLWRATTGELLQTFEGHTLGVVAVKFSPNGRYLATGSSDGTIKIWDINTGSLVQTLTGHLVGAASGNENRVLSIDYSPDGQFLVSSSSDETIKLWNALTGECLHTYQVLPPYAGMDITGVTGLTAATIAALRTLGAVDRFPVLSGC